MATWDGQPQQNARWALSRSAVLSPTEWRGLEDEMLDRTLELSRLYREIGIPSPLGDTAKELLYDEE